MDDVSKSEVDFAHFHNRFYLDFNNSFCLEEKISYVYNVNKVHNNVSSLVSEVSL